MRRLARCAALVVSCAAGLGALAQGPGARREFAPGSWTRLGELPDTPFRRRLESLPESARARALEVLRRIHFTGADLPSLRADSAGGVYFADGFPLPATPPPSTPSAPSSGASVPVRPFPSGLVLHSRPGSPNVLHLDFDGEDVSGTFWNTDLGRTVIRALPFSADADTATFNDAEQAAIRTIWQRVAEDFAAFEIDVTTERPATFNNRTAHLLVTRSTDAGGGANPASTAGGVAYVDVFGRTGYANYRPAWVYADNLGNVEAYIAEAASHEVGHNLGLTHDGTTDGSEYYGGHGSGETSWGPLMGAPYSRNVTQWSRGDYRLANNTQDDFATVAAKVGYRADDHGNTPGAATPLVVAADGAVRATTPAGDPGNLDPANKGVLERGTDVDVFSFVTGGGRVLLEVMPWRVSDGVTLGGNADLTAELRDPGGAVVAASDPSDRTSARLDVQLPAGGYYLHLRPAGTGSPLASPPTGYPAHGSLGQYFISGQIVPGGNDLPPVAELAVQDLTRNGVAEWTFNVAYTDDRAVAVGTLDGGDLRITGPGGYDRLAPLRGVTPSGDGTPRVATYAAPAPDGVSWKPADNGAYAIALEAGQVTDTGGTAVPAGVLGGFAVAIPTAVYAAPLDTDPGWTLAGRWEYGVPRYGSAGPSGGHTGDRILGYNLGGNYENRLALTWASTPPIDASAATALTLRFHRWLRLRNGDTAAVQVSTNGTDWTSLWQSQRTVADNAWREIQFPLPAWTDGARTLRLRWGLGSGPAQNDIGWNLDDIEVLAGGTLDVTPPSAALSIADVTLAGAPTHSFTVTYSDDTAVAVATLDAGDIAVTGPGGAVLTVTLEGVDAGGDGTPRAATYSVAAPGGAWDPEDNGTYEVALVEDEVADPANNAAPGRVLGTFAAAMTAEPVGLVVTPAVLPVPEGGVASFLVRASRAPAAPLAVSVRRLDGDPDLGAAPGPFALDAGNWADGVPVEIRAAADADALAGTATFEFTAADRPPVNAIAREVEPAPVEEFTLAVTARPEGWGTVAPESGTFPAGTSVEVVATPAAYYRFDRWSGAADTAANPLLLVMERDAVLEARFAEVLTVNHPTPLWWLASVGVTSDFEAAVDRIGANGFAYWESYIAGLVPDDPASRLALRVVAAGDGSVALEWDPVAGRVYTVLGAADPSGPFAPLDGAAGLDPSVRRVTRPASGDDGPRFYRLRVEKP